MKNYLFNFDKSLAVAGLNVEVLKNLLKSTFKQMKTHAEK